MASIGGIKGHNDCYRPSEPHGGRLNPVRWCSVYCVETILETRIQESEELRQKRPNRFGFNRVAKHGAAKDIKSIGCFRGHGFTMVIPGWVGIKGDSKVAYSISPLDHKGTIHVLSGEYRLTFVESIAIDFISLLKGPKDLVNPASQDDGHLC